MRLLIVLAFCGVGILIVYLWMQTLALQRHEQKMLPLLEKLLRNPTLQSEHQHFLQAVRERDQHVQQIRSRVLNLGFTYVPTPIMSERLLAHLALHPEDKMGHERFLGAFRKAEFLGDANLLEALLKQYVERPNALAQERIELCLGKAIVLSPSLIPTLRTYLFETPITFGSARNFYEGATKLFGLPKEQRQRLYNMTLDLLRQNPRSVAARKLVLDVGRWHFAKSPDVGRGYFGKFYSCGSPTMFDEERISHDIQMATASGKVTESSAISLK